MEICLKQNNHLNETLPGFEDNSLSLLLFLKHFRHPSPSIILVSISDIHTLESVDFYKNSHF